MVIQDGHIHGFALVANLHHSELGEANFYDLHCEREGGTSWPCDLINVGYGVWRECIAEIITKELDNSWDVPPLWPNKPLLAQLRQEIKLTYGKRAMSQILVEVTTSNEVDLVTDRPTARRTIDSLRLFDSPAELPLMKFVFK